MMKSLGRGICCLTVLTWLTGAGWSAETARVPAGKTSTAATSSRASGPGARSAKGPLPDPLLLDGAAQPAEKKSEYGMIGDFESPGDENVRDGKVGGPQNQNQNSSGGGQNSNQGAGSSQGGGGGAQGAQQQGGGGAQGAQGGQQGGGGAQGAQGGQQGGQQGGGAQGGAQGQAGAIQPGGGGQGGGPENANAGGNPVGGAGDAGGQAQGVQVAELGGNPSGGQAGAAGGGAGGKPQPVAIGDKAMRIEQTAPVPGVVGTQQQIVDGHVQQHDKGTGTGGKAPTGTQGPGRIEKGRPIPAGL